MSGYDAFTDEDLTAYLDGEAEPGRARVIDEALAKDKALQSRLDRLSIPVVDIKAAFDKLALTAPGYPMSLEAAVPQKRGFAELMRPIAATAVLCLVTGWFAAELYDREKSEGWHKSVAVYHALYVTGTLADVNQSPAAAADELTRVSNTLGRPIALDALMASKNLDYKRAQVLGFEGRPLIQLAFLSKAGAPVALCIIRNNKSGDSKTKFGSMLGMATASWSKGAYDYLLVGGNDAAMISEAAALFSTRL
jgi:anti-sigma factor RsiW